MTKSPFLVLLYNLEMHKSVESERARINHLDSRNSELKDTYLELLDPSWVCPWSQHKTSFLS